MVRGSLDNRDGMGMPGSIIPGLSKCRQQTQISALGEDLKMNLLCKRRKWCKVSIRSGKKTDLKETQS